MCAMLMVQPAQCYTDPRTITETLCILLHAMMSRECTCYCQACACKEFAKVLAEKCKIKCPVCQREANRIVVNEAADDERVPALRRCKSAVTVREKLEEEVSGVHRAVVPVQRESSNQTIDEGIRKTNRELAIRRYNETMSAIRKLLEKTPAVQKAEILSQQVSSSQIVVKTRQNTPRSLTLSRYVKALSAIKKLVDAISDMCGAEIRLQQEPSSQRAEEDKQNSLTYSVMGLYEEAMSALEKVTEELLGNSYVEIPDHRKSTSQAVVEAIEHTRWGDLTKHTYEKTKAVFDKLREVVWSSTIVETLIKQAPSDQTVVEDTWPLRQVPLLHRCDSATFSWDRQCPICQTTQDVDPKSRCVSSRLTNCVPPRHCCSRHLCYCIKRYSKKIVKKLKCRETRVCPFPFCRKQVDRVIMNAAPWKPRTVEEVIKECLPCKVKKEAIKAAEQTQKKKGSSSTTKNVSCKTGDNTQKTGDSSSKTRGEASKSAECTQKTKAPTTKEKGETSKAATDRAQKTNSSAPTAKKEDNKSGGSSKKSKGASSKTTVPHEEAVIPTCSAVHGDT